jgi:hypothetical protein
MNIETNHEWLTRARLRLTVSATFRQDPDVEFSLTLFHGCPQ